MMTHIRLWLDTLRTSLWFVPAVLVGVAVVLAYSILAIDAALPTEWWQSMPWLDRLLDVRSTGASAMLQTIGGSIITIAGVVFSITIAALALASAQYTSRVLRNFIRDPANQVVLGVFLGTFVYCLLIMRTLSGVSEVSRAPALAMLVALALAFVGIGVLIYFIHHIATHLQAAYIVASIAHDALPAIDRYCAQHQGAEDPVVDRELPERGIRHSLRATRSGYVTGIDIDALIASVEACDGILRVIHVPGDFMAAGEEIAVLQCAQLPDEDDLQSIRNAWSLWIQRTLENDPGYGLRQLVDVAMKALSPAINESTTAIMCLNWIEVILLRMADRQVPPRVHVRDGRVRVLIEHPGIGDFIDLGFDQIRHNAHGNVAVLARQIDILEVLADSDAAAHFRQRLQQQAAALEATVRSSVSWPPERTPLLDRLATLQA